MNDVSGSTTYSYDSNRDWLVGKTKTIGSLTTTLNYTNDLAGNVVALKSSTANGTLVYYQWDALNRLAGVSGPMVGQTTYSYNGAGSLAGKMDFNNCEMKPARSWHIRSMRKSSSLTQLST